MIVYKLLPDGAFIVGDTETRNTSYAYPTSTNATQAKRKPVKVAAEMTERANRLAECVPSKFAKEYDARNWERLGAAQA